MERLIKLDGLSCEDCKANVEEIIMNCYGVKSCNVNWERGIGKVKFDEEAITIQEVIQAINRSDSYKALVV